MNKEFVPYEQSLALKELGFNEMCFSTFIYKVPELQWELNFVISDNRYIGTVAAPTFSQAFRWFREKYNLQVYIDFYHKDSYFYKIKSQVGKEISNTTGDVILQGTPVFPRSYEEAELECLNKLIEIVKNK
jgi:hypothetical protein